MTYADGDRARISTSYHWAKGAAATISRPPQAVRNLALSEAPWTGSRRLVKAMRASRSPQWRSWIVRATAAIATHAAALSTTSCRDRSSDGGTSAAATIVSSARIPSHKEEQAQAAANQGASAAEFSPADAERQRVLCEARDFAACANLAAAHYHGRGAPNDKVMAARLYRIACDGGRFEACDHLGYMYMLGEGGLAKSATDAYELYRRACDGGNAGGCRNSAVAHHQGLGVERDVKQALALYQKACERGCADGCNGLGWLYEHGEGVEKDMKHAVELYSKACEGGPAAGCPPQSAPGCTNLAEMYRLGAGGLSRDEERAAELLGTACSGGWGDACFRLASIYDQRSPSSRSEAIRLRERACDLGYEEACTGTR
jgi:TPR repeat protein